MEAGHTSAAGAMAARIERAAVFSGDDVEEKLIQLGFENSLEAAQYEVAPGSGINEET